MNQPERSPSIARNRGDDLAHYVRIQISDNGLRAELMIEPHTPPSEPTTIAQLIALLRQEGIVYGLRPPALHAALRRINGFCRSRESFTIALGEPPEKGTDVLVQPAISLALPCPNDLDRSHGLALAAVEACGAVVAGDILAEIRVDSSLHPGRSVFGEDLHPIHTALLHLKIGSGIETDLHEDRLFLRAKRAGMALLEPPHLDVLPLEVVQGPLKVPPSGIEFADHVLVVGRVTGTGKLQTPGHLFVTKAVDGVSLEIGGSVVLGAGYLGRQSAVAHCSGSFSTRTVERARVEAGSEIYVVAGVVQSQLVCGGEVRVDGAIVGGTVTAGLNIHARQIGSSSGTDTQITLNPVLRYRQSLADLQDEIKQLKANWKKLERLSFRLQPRGTLGGDDAPASPELARVAAEQSLVGRKLKQLMETRVRLLRAAQAETAQVKVIVAETLHPGTFLRIGDSEAEIVSARTSVQIELAAESDAIHIRPIPETAS